MWGWYWILYNSILYNPDLTDKQKLLYVSVSSLCAEKGYCYASNQYFIEKWFAKNWETITRNLKKLEQLNFLNIEYEKEWTKIKKRIITIDSKVGSHWFQSQPPIDSKVKENNTSINIINNKQAEDIYLFYRNKIGKSKWDKKSLSLERIIKAVKLKWEDIIRNSIIVYSKRNSEEISKWYAKAPQYFFWPSERWSKVFYYEDFIPTKESLEKIEENKDINIDEFTF